MEATTFVKRQCTDGIHTAGCGTAILSGMSRSHVLQQVSRCVAHRFWVDGVQYTPVAESVVPLGAVQHVLCV